MVAALVAAAFKVLVADEVAVAVGADGRRVGGLLAVVVAEPTVVDIGAQKNALVAAAGITRSTGDLTLAGNADWGASIDGGACGRAISTEDRVRVGIDTGALADVESFGALEGTFTLLTKLTGCAGITTGAAMFLVGVEEATLTRAIFKSRSAKEFAATIIADLVGFTGLATIATVVGIEIGVDTGTRADRGVGSTGRGTLPIGAELVGPTGVSASTTVGTINFQVDTASGALFEAGAAGGFTEALITDLIFTASPVAISTMVGTDSRIDAFTATTELVAGTEVIVGEVTGDAETILAGRLSSTFLITGTSQTAESAVEFAACTQEEERKKKEEQEACKAARAR